MIRKGPYVKTIQNAAIYARVSTTDQNCDMQLSDLREYCERRGWNAVEYVDTGVSGAKSSREQLDRLMQDARRRKSMWSSAGASIGSHAPPNTC
jgi:DNA invertase Pin-like site-specific DNA recombinase